MQALKYLFPGWYAVVMGLAGLSLAWHRAGALLGSAADAAALAAAGVATLAFVVLAAATALRALRHPEAWDEDRRHPVRHTFIATLPIAVILLATVAVVLFGAGPIARALWWAGALGQLSITLWVLSRWLRDPKAGGAQWASVTPALLIPIVGNVLVPLAGVPLGHEVWSAAQFGIGLLFWPVVMVLMVARILTQGLWPERLRPTVFIVIAPPAVVGLALLQFGAPALWGWALWGMALFAFLWAGTQAKAIAAMPFALPHWGLSFPLAAFAALTLRLAEPASAAMVLGVVLLALATLVIAALTVATLRGLVKGSLLVPEPAPPAMPGAA
jgi:tellurite resistance protein